MRQPVHQPGQLTVADVGPAEVQRLGLTTNDADEVSLTQPTSTQVDRRPQPPVVTPPIPRLTDPHTPHQVCRAQQAEDADPEVVLQRMIGPAGQRNVARWRRDGRRTDHVLAHCRHVGQDDVGGWLVQTTQQTHRLVLTADILLLQSATGRLVRRQSGLTTLYTDTKSIDVNTKTHVTKMPEILFLTSDQVRR